MWMWPRSQLCPSSLVALSTNMLAFRYGMGLWVACGSRTGNVCLHVELLFSYGLISRNSVRGEDRTV